MCILILFDGRIYSGSGSEDEVDRGLQAAAATRAGRNVDLSAPARATRLRYGAKTQRRSPVAPVVQEPHAFLRAGVARAPERGLDHLEDLERVVPAGATRSRPHLPADFCSVGLPALSC